MTVPASLRVGWCPGVLRPMMAGDGFLVRIKPRGGALSIAQARGVATLCERYGNGILNITGRANLQLRGVLEPGLPTLTEALADLGLLDPSPEGEAARNVVSSPLAGHDPSAIMDIRPVVAALERRLVSDPALWRLPAKFAWAVEDGGDLGLSGIAADVRFEAVRHGGDVVFAIELAGAPEPVATCQPKDVAEAAAALAGAFIEVCAAHQVQPHHMRDLVVLCGSGPIVEAATHVPGSLLLPFSGEGGPASARTDGDFWAPPCPNEDPIYPGLRRSTLPGAGKEGAWRPIGFCRAPRSWIGVAPPFGRLESATLARFAGKAEAVGAQDIRLTPWRSILVSGLAEVAAAKLWSDLGTNDEAAESLDSGALILDPADPRLAVAACAGAPACPRATTPVQRDAARLASLLPRGSSDTRLHVSGCGKGCAHAGPAPVTLVGRDGAYDLVRHGKAGDAPERTGLDLESVLATLQNSDMVSAC